MEKPEKKEVQVDVQRIQKLASDLLGIAEVLERDPSTAIAALAIALGTAGASHLTPKDEICRLFDTYYDKTDKVLSEMEAALKGMGKPPETTPAITPSIKKDTSLN